MLEHTSATTIGGFRSQPERCNNAVLAYRLLRYGGRLLHGVILLLAFPGAVSFCLTGGYAILISTGSGTDPRRGPWRGPEDIEFATLEWVHWYNTQRLLEPIGNVAPVEYEVNYYRLQEGSLEMARLN